MWLTELFLVFLFISLPHVQPQSYASRQRYPSNQKISVNNQDQISSTQIQTITYQNGQISNQQNSNQFPQANFDINSQNQYPQNYNHNQHQSNPPPNNYPQNQRQTQDQNWVNNQQNPNLPQNYNHNQHQSNPPPNYPQNENQGQIQDQNWAHNQQNPNLPLSTYPQNQNQGQIQDQNWVHNQQNPNLNYNTQNQFLINTNNNPNRRQNLNQNHYYDMSIVGEAMRRYSNNIVTSPFGSLQMLSMITEAAQGLTKKELLEVLQSTYIGQNLGRDYSNQTLEQLKQLQSVQLKLTNHIFVSDKLQVNKHYHDILHKYYKAGISRIRFLDAIQSSNAINGWVSKATNGFIKDIIKPEEIPMDAAAVMLNALYFKGLWENKFDKTKTESRCFHHQHNDCHSYAWLMAASGKHNFAYSEELRAKVLELPYQGNQVSLLLFLPDSSDGLGEMVDLLPGEYDKVINKLTRQDVIAGIPRFSFDFKLDLKTVLDSLGIQRIFHKDEADLRKLTDGQKQFYISDMLQNARIEVNEDGTKAAAVTQSNVISLAGITKPRFIADHPFVFFIRHVESGAILFAGRVAEPTRAPPPTPKNNRQQRQPNIDLRKIL